VCGCVAVQDRVPPPCARECGSSGRLPSLRCSQTAAMCTSLNTADSLKYGGAHHYTWSRRPLFATVGVTSTSAVGDRPALAPKGEGPELARSRVIFCKNHYTIGRIHRVSLLGLTKVLFHPRFMQSLSSWSPSNRRTPPARAQKPHRHASGPRNRSGRSMR